MDYSKIITIEPGKRSGKPCIRGMRITVYDILGYLASGMSEAEILDDFSELTQDDIRASLAFAADSERRTKTLHGFVGAFCLKRKNRLNFFPRQSADSVGFFRVGDGNIGGRNNAFAGDVVNFI